MDALVPQGAGKASLLADVTSPHRTRRESNLVPGMNPASKGPNSPFSRAEDSCTQDAVTVVLISVTGSIS
jgi:hypothetical protein